MRFHLRGLAGIGEPGVLKWSILLLAIGLAGCGHATGRAAGTTAVPATGTGGHEANGPATAHETSAVPENHYDPRVTFAPLTLPQPVNAYRAGNGSPGPDYWQNRADYVLHATLDPTQQKLTGSEVITYTNNSPQALESLWIQLDQNTYRADARTRFVHDRLTGPSTQGDVLDSVRIDEARGGYEPDYVVSDTRMQIRLAHPLAAHGGTLRIRIDYHYTVPGRFGGRTQHVPTRNGEIYDIAQWYPRMAVYDDQRGWDTLPFLGSEFYLEYGSFDYYVTVPWDMLVAGSGELQNPQQVLTAQERARLQQARGSDRTVVIRGADEVTDPASRPVQHGTLTWHFKLAPARDVAFAASRAFIWDAARANLPGGRQALAMSFYPVESTGDGGWQRCTEFLKNSIENFSRRWASYPYPTAVAVGGPVGGMEYPAMLFDSMQLRGKMLFALTAHEIGHTWFPMMVGSNERRHEWMDEGFNTFIDVYESEDFNHGEFAPKQDPEFAPASGTPADQIVPLMLNAAVPAVMSSADGMPPRFGHPVYYFKTALGLKILREQVLGPERFDWAFRKYIRDWSWRHPTPSDFFRAMDSAAGEDLSWFWRGWFFNNWTLDLAVLDVQPAAGGWSHGAVLTIANLQPLVLPASVLVQFTDGSSQQLQVPAETWMQQGTARLQLASTQPVKSVVVDPGHLLPDRDRANNSWPRGAQP
jgi:hypothetical protein